MTNPLATTFAAIATDTEPFLNLLDEMRCTHLNGDHEEAKEWFWQEVITLLDNQAMARALSVELRSQQ